MPMFHRLMGPTHHPLEEIESLNSYKDDENSNICPTLKQHLNHLQLSGIVLVNLVYMDGASLQARAFKKEKCYYGCRQLCFWEVYSSVLSSISLWCIHQTRRHIRTIRSKCKR